MTRQSDVVTSTAPVKSCSSTVTDRASRPCSPITKRAADCADLTTFQTTYFSRRLSSTSWRRLVSFHSSSCFLFCLLNAVNLFIYNREEVKKSVGQQLGYCSAVQWQIQDLGVDVERGNGDGAEFWVRSVLHPTG